MNKISKIVLIGLISFVFVGCGDNNPKGAAENFFNSIIDGNAIDFKKYSTESTQNILMYFCSKDIKTDKELSQCLKEDISANLVQKFKIVDVKENGKTSAIVVVEQHNKNGVFKEEIRVEQIADKWKVDTAKR